MDRFAYSDSLEVAPVAAPHDEPKEQPNDPIATKVPIGTVGTDVKFWRGDLTADVVSGAKSDLGEFPVKAALTDMCRAGGGIASRQTM